MPVNSTHPEYDSGLPAWLRARDVFAGEDAVKAANERFLPRLDTQTDDEYAAYKARASFFNATARTVDGFVGLIFRREPTVKLPERVSGVAGALRVFAEDVDLLGTSLYTFSKNIVSEVLTVGRAGTLVDWGGSATGHYGEERGYVVRYTAEQIINWRASRVNGRNVVTLVVLHEIVAESSEDDFDITEIEQLRVLKLVNARPHPGPLPRGEGADDELPSNAVPKAVRDATCEQARELLIVDRTAAPEGEGLKYFFEASSQKGYDKNDKRPVISGVAQSLLAKLGQLLKRRSGAVRLVRA